MPNMVPRNRKAKLTWLISKTGYSPTAYCVFEDAYNGKVDSYNAIYGPATAPVKVLLDAELRGVDAAADGNPADYVEAQRKLDAWETVFAAMKSYLDASAAFEQRDKTKVSEEEDAGFARRAAEITGREKAFAAADFSEAAKALQQLTSGHGEAAVEHAKKLKLETTKTRDQIKDKHRGRGSHLNLLFQRIGAEPEALAKYQKDAGVVLAYQTAFEEAEKMFNASASELPPALKSKLEQTLKEHAVIVKSADDVETARQKTETLKGFASVVEDGKAFRLALAAVDNEWPPSASEGAEKSGAAISERRAAAFDAGTIEPGRLREATGQLVELLAVVKACRGYLTVFNRIKVPCKKAAASAPSFGPRYEAAVRPAAQATAPTAQLFVDQQKILEALEAVLPHVGTYAAASAAVSKEYAAIKKMSPPSGEEQKRVSTVNGKLEASIAVADTLANTNGKYEEAVAALQAIQQTLATEREARTKAVKAAALKLVTGTPRKDLFDKLGGGTGPGGEDLVASLYAEFGRDGFVAFLEAMDGDDKDKAAGNIGALGGSLGATGIKGLCDSFSGSSASKLPGAGNLGTLLKKGVTTAQLSEVQAAYADEPDKLKVAFKTGFSGDAELFAGIFTTGLQGTPKKPDEDLRTQNLKKLTDAFSDQADLQKLVNGLASKKGGAARAGKEKAGARMNAVLTNHFKGDPAKLKDPFLDSLKKQPDIWSKEKTDLEAAKKAHQDFEALSVQEKKKVKPKPATWTAANENRLTFVKGVIAQYTADTLDTTIRNAASFKTASLKDEDLTMPATDLHGLGCSNERVEHFAKRHTRDHFPFKGAELASEDEPLNSDQRKPASLWPEGTGVQEIKVLLRDALNAITIPTYAQVATLDPTTKPDFAQIDTEITAGTERLKVRIGFQRTPPNKVNVTQFYPRKQAKLDTICFEDMHGIKRALGK